MRKLVSKKTGRPPKQKTVEKRVEKLLTGKQEPEKPRIGRPPKTYEERPEHIRYIIDCAAIGLTPSKILGLLEEKYGEAAQVVSISTIKSYIKRYVGEIIQREKELRVELPLLSPVHRVRYLQKIVDEAFEGQEIFDRQGNSIGMKKDYSVIVQAIKEMNSMQKDIDAQKTATAAEARMQNEVNEQKAILDEYVTKLAAENGKTKLEVLYDITEEFINSAPEALEQLASEYKM